MKLKVVVHNAEEGGYWAEVPSIPGCHTQGDTWDELLQNIYEAIEAYMSVDTEDFELKPDDKVLEIRAHCTQRAQAIRAQAIRPYFMISLFRSTAFSENHATAKYEYHHAPVERFHCRQQRLLQGRTPG